MRRRIVSNPSLPLLFTLEKAVYLKINVIFHKSWARRWNFRRGAILDTGIPPHHSLLPLLSTKRDKHIYFLLVSWGNCGFIQLMWDKKY